MGVTTSTPDVLVVGAGPAGLTAATALAGRVGSVLVLDRERQAGGIPRHSDHLGYGIRDLHRLTTGPRYAARLVDLARAAGAQVRTEAMVTRVEEDRTVEVTTPDGLLRVRPRALVLATGARERPRTARLVAGSRPAGVFTTGYLQNLVHGLHRSPGHRAVVVGAEPVSLSAVLTLRRAGCRTVAMTTVHRSAETYRGLALAGTAVLGVPVVSRARVLRIEGRERVSAVVLQHLDTGRTARLDCDTVVFTGDWIPDDELARSAGLELAAGSGGPEVDSGLRTSAAGVFAAGNLVHPVDTADVAALDGRHVATAVLSWLRDGDFPTGGARLRAEPPLRWIAPSRLVPGGGRTARGRLLAWTQESVRFPLLNVRQDGRVLGRHRVAWPAAPGRVFRIPQSVLGGVDPTGGDVSIGFG